MTVTTATIGYPRIGPRREQKTTVELFWKNKATAAELLNTQHAVEAQAWTSQKNAGVELIGVDGTLYDQILDTVFLLGIIPKRFQHLSGLDQYFALARGAEGAQALDMSKFFDTNYHFMVPELEQGWSCQLNCTELLGKVSRCQSIVGKSAAVPIIIGPVTFAALARRQDPTETLQQCVDKLLPTYKALLSELTKLRVPEVQLHEPYLTTTKAIGLREVYTTAYSALASCGLPINLCTYYDDLSSAVYPWAVALPVAAVSLDFLGVPGAAEPNLTLQLLREHGFPTDKRLGAGVVDGRSVWADTGFAHVLVAELVSRGLNVCVQTSAPLQHLPLDVRMETTLSDDLKSRLGFAVQKLDELVAVARKAASVKAGSIILCDLAAWQPKDLAVPVAEELFHRSLPFEERRAQQVQYHAFPTTTIGSFPQTAEVRRLRLQHKQGKLSTEAYDRAMAAHIGYAVGIQEALGIDVLVHGEFERTDMVEYFGQHLEGMAFTEHAWVQSYGSRYVRPPLIVSDIKFTGPMTVREFQLAQSLTTRPMKGMLTGPITMLNWSFPRRDITRSAQAKQLALALRQEVAALQDAGCRVVQVDDPALREGLPLKDERWAAYLKWAVDAFRLTTAVAAPSMQVVTHLCYSDFADIMGAIDAMDADVLTIENSRSGDEMVKALAASGYSKDLGPGVYDVHSPVVPEVAFIREKLKSFAATGVLHGRLDRIHCNPDCGLKTRGWAETIPALKNMVQAAAEARAELGGCEKAETGKDSADKGAWKPAHRCC